MSPGTLNNDLFLVHEFTQPETRLTPASYLAGFGSSPSPAMAEFSPMTPANANAY
jgi:hypothetical protein